MLGSLTLTLLTHPLLCSQSKVLLLLIPKQRARQRGELEEVTNQHYSSVLTYNESDLLEKTGRAIDLAKDVDTAGGDVHDCSFLGRGRWNIQENVY